jgi:hypothetical protein
VLKPEVMPGQARALVVPRSPSALVGKQSASAAAAPVFVVNDAEKKKRKRKATSPSAVVTPSILTPRSREVESKDEEEDEAIKDLPVAGDQPVRRSESCAA